MVTTFKGKQYHKVLNLFCKQGQHDKCPAVSKGSKSDPVTFICTCDCHKQEGNK